MNLVPVIVDTGTDVKGTTMADRSGLQFVGFIFAIVTLAVPSTKAGVASVLMVYVRVHTRGFPVAVSAVAARSLVPG